MDHVYDDDNNRGSSNEDKKTTTMTFRISGDTMKKLRAESDQRDVSLNTLVNQILKRFVEWDMYEPKVGMIPIAKPIVVDLFGKLSKEEVVEMALRVGKSSVHDIALFMKARIDFDSFLSWFEDRMKNSLVEVNHSVENGAHTYILNHDLGENWSLYHKTILELTFNNLFDKRVQIEATSTTLALTFDE